MERPHRLLACCLASIVWTACGSSGDASSPSPAPEPAPTDPPAEESSPSPAASADPSAPPAPSDPPAPPAAPAEPVDLLHAVPAAVAVSSAYRGAATQPPRLVDGDLETAWNAETGELDRSWIAFRVPADATITSIQMTVGFTHATERADLFTGNHRVARVRVTRGGETVAEQALDSESRALQTIAIEGPGGDYRIELVELLPGSREDWRETCVSELRVMGRAPDAYAGAYTPRVAVGSLPELGPALTEEELAELEEQEDARIDAEIDAELDQTARVYVEQAEGPGLAFDEIGVDRITGARRFARDADGWVWICIEDGGGTLRSPYGDVPLPPGVSCGAIAARPDRRAWLLSNETLRVHDGSAWAITESTGLARPNDIAVDGAGTLWVVAPEGIARSEGGGFRSVPVRGEVERMYRVLAAGEHVVVQHSSGLLRREGDAFAAIAITGPDGPVGGFGAAALAPDGTVVAAHTEALYLAPAAGAPRRVAYDTFEGKPLSVGALAFDGSGRLWMWADSGLYLLGPGDFTRVVRRYPPGSLPDLTGSALGGMITSWVRGLWVERSGPEPLPRPERPAGRVHGRLVRGGAPLAGASLLFCTGPIRGNLGSGYTDPCERTAESEYGYVRHVQTRADGTFDFWDAPAEETINLVTFRSDRGWFISPDRTCCRQRRSGRDLDLGDVEIP